MSHPGDRGSESSPLDHPGRNQTPLVIVSERGRHTEESRRIVRAQAARASAAQSRVTRARNRGEREGSLRDALQPSPTTDLPQISGASIGSGPAAPNQPYGPLPLAAWLPTVLDGAAAAIVQQASAVVTAAPASGAALSARMSPAVGTFGFRSPGSGEAVQSPTEASKFQLPLALPRGFTALQQRIPVSDAMLGLLSRTACIDFASTGVEQRLHQLLFDLIANVAGSALAMQPGHPIQSHLRVACACLTIFQGQRANGQIFAQDPRYQVGLEAAWSEATLLDQSPLAGPKAAEASLWAVFIINVTTGSTANFFHQQLYGLLHDLQLQYWEQVRKVLLDFVYPVSFLDEPCKSFYHNLQSVQVAAG